MGPTRPLAGLRAGVAPLAGVAGTVGLLLLRGHAAGDRERRDESSVLGLHARIAADSERAPGAFLRVGTTVADHRFGVARDHVDAHRGADPDRLGDRGAAGDRDQIGGVLGAHQQRLRLVDSHRAGTDLDVGPVVDLGQGLVVRHGDDDGAVEPEVAGLAAGRGQGHTNGLRVGGNRQTVGAQEHAVLDGREDVVAVVEDLDCDTGGAVALSGGAAEPGLLQTAVREPGLLLRGGGPLDPECLEVAAQVQGMVHRVGLDRHPLGIRGVGCLEGAVLIDPSPVLHGRLGVLVHDQDREGTGQGDLLPVHAGLGPGVDEVVVEPQVAVQVGR